MKYFAHRLMLLALLCLVSACQTGIMATNLKVVSLKQEEKQPFQSIGYVIHADIYGSKSWVDALSELTSMENIFVATENEPKGLVYDYQDYIKTHNVVHIYLEEIPRTISEEVLYGPTMYLSLFTFSAIPAYMPYHKKVIFQLSLSEQPTASPLFWDYRHDRQEYIWLPLFPIADFVSGFNGSGDGQIDRRWQVEEKRRLLYRFIKDATPVLAKNP